MTTKRPWSPLKMAIATFIVVVVVAFGIFAVAIATSDDTDAQLEARSEKFGSGLAPFSLICAGAAYLRRKRKLEGK